MLAILLSLTAARADQCAWVSKETAHSAVKYLQTGAVWASYCEPCGDRKPTYKTVAESAVARQASSPEYWEVVVDGQPVDLAYVYVVRAPDDKKLGNLAFLTNCPATDVSKTIPRNR